MRKHNLLLTALLISVSACGDGPTGGKGKPPVNDPLTLSQSEITLTQVGQIGTVIATSGGQAVSASFTVKQETRYLHDMPVLDAASLAGGSIKAIAPGVVVLSVSSPGKGSADLTVRFTPSGPVVLAIANTTPAGGDEPARLRGYRMHDIVVSKIRVGGIDEPALVSRDSANLVLSIPVASGNSACTTGGNGSISVPDASVAPGLYVSRRTEGELSLAVGESVVLTTEQQSCLKIGAVAGGSKYALAFFDDRGVRRAESGFEGTAGDYTVTIGEVGNGVSAIASRAYSQSPNIAPSTGIARQVAGSTNPFSRTEPYVSDEIFATSSGSAKVVRIYEASGIVIADLLGDEGSQQSQPTIQYLEKLDIAMDFLQREIFPLYRKVYADGNPITSEGSKQLLIILQSCQCDPVAVTHGKYAVIYIPNRNPLSEAGDAVSLFAHEIAHAWQAAYFATQDNSELGNAPGWAKEGNAKFMEYEALRRFGGIEFNANWNKGQAANYSQGKYGQAISSNGLLTSETNYQAGASFQRDLVQRLVSNNTSLDNAIHLTSRGLLEGWYGYDRNDATPSRPGLVQRMRDVIPGWEPSSAVLLWTLSQAVDDATTSILLRNISFLNAYTGWTAAAIFRTGKQATQNNALLNSNATTISHIGGGAHYVRIEDDGRGGAYRLTSSVQGSVRWMIVRYQ